jgi:YegS/Rv2252/BmrU family lipid kinase
MQRSFLVITNASAGSADHRAIRAVLDVLRGGADVARETLEGPDGMGALLQRHPERTPVAAGGDGTLHLLVAALHERDMLPDRVVGCVPLGTGNDFARTLRIPLEPAEAARVLLHGAPRELDLLTDDAGGVVVNAAHLGIGAQGSREGEPLKPILGMLAYRVGALVAGVRSKGWPLRVTVDGSTITDGDTPVLQVGLLNGRTIGGGTPLAPEAEPDDGLADVVISTAVGPLARARYARLLSTGEHLAHPDVTLVRGREVEIVAEGAPVPINADGELAAGSAGGRWSVQPRAWRMLAPTDRRG